MRSHGLFFFILAIVPLFGCASYTDKIRDGLDAYRQGRMADAYDAFTVARDKTDDEHLVDLERGMAGMALGDADLAVQNFTRAIDGMDVLVATPGVGDAVAYVLDDTAAPYPGAPYEQICARLLLGMSYLLTPDPFENVSAACRDMDNKMEGIEAYYRRSYEFDGSGREARFSFQIPPLAKYFAALAAERRGALDNAGIYMNQAVAGSPGRAFFRNERDRIARGERENLVFVFACLGLIPHKVEGESPELTGMVRGIKALYALAEPDSNPDAITRVDLTAPVRIPVIPGRRPFPHGGFLVRTGTGGDEVRTGVAADFDAYARREYLKILPGIMIRAAVRRAIKEAAGQILGAQLSEDDAEMAKAIGDIFSSVASAAETVDTRSWCTLPREFHAATLVLGEGDREIVLTPRTPQGGRMGPDITVPLDRSKSSPAFVFVIQAAEGAPPIVIVDADHRLSANP